MNKCPRCQNSEVGEEDRFCKICGLELKDNNSPHNPGLSEKAWDKLHALMAQLILKYAHRNRGEVTKKKGA